jgi:hypothetical protein
MAHGFGVGRGRGAKIWMGSQSFAWIWMGHEEELEPDDLDVAGRRWTSDLLRGWGWSLEAWTGQQGEGEVEDAPTDLPAGHEEHLVVILIGGRRVWVTFDGGEGCRSGGVGIGTSVYAAGSRSLDWKRSAAETPRSIGRA